MGERQEMNGNEKLVKNKGESEGEHVRWEIIEEHDRYMEWRTSEWGEVERLGAKTL